jgi:serine/threonine protein kinase
MSNLVMDFRGHQVIRVLGEGSFGTVTLVSDPSTGSEIALKTFNAKPGQDLSDVFFRELQSLVELAHPCVLQIVGYSLLTHSRPAQIGTKFAANGSLRDALDKVPRPAFLDETGIAIVAIGIVVGMQFIHSRGVLHRDLKPANILLDEHGYPQIGDLGSSRFGDMGLTMTAQVGTPLYMAPETYDDSDYTTAVDVYSFALMLYELVVGAPAFPPTISRNALYRKVVTGERPKLPANLCDEVKETITLNWAVSPAGRDSFEEVFDRLAAINFKVTAGVDTQRVANFLSFIHCEYQPRPPAPVNPEPPQQPPNVPKAPQQPPVVVQTSQAPPNVPKAPQQSPIVVQTPHPPPNVPKAPTRSIECPLQFKNKKNVPGKEKPTNSMNGIIAWLTKECGGNVDQQGVVEVTSSTPVGSQGWCAARNVVDLAATTYFMSACRAKKDNIPDAGNNCICYDFKNRRIIPKHYAIRTHWYDPGWEELRAWAVETSDDGNKWQEADRRESSRALTGRFTRTFAIARAAECRFIRLVNVGRNHLGDDQLCIEAWEIFGTIIE